MDKIKKGVRLDHISKIYQDPKTGKDFYAVKDTSLTIEPGSFVTLLGPSGCGKTTTLRMIAGFESPDEGEIYLGDEPINALTPNKRDTAMVFQSYALLPGVLTPTDVATSLQFGYKTMKLFPAGSMPRHYVKDLQGPFDGTNYMAIGGVSPANIREFFDAGCISVGLASSLMPKDAVAANDWEACAAYVRSMVEQIRR